VFDGGGFPHGPWLAGRRHLGPLPHDPLHAGLGHDGPSQGFYPGLFTRGFWLMFPRQTLRYPILSFRVLLAHDDAGIANMPDVKLRVPQEADGGRRPCCGGQPGRGLGPGGDFVPHSCVGREESIADGLANLVVIVRPKPVPGRDLLEKLLLSELGGLGTAMTVEDGEKAEEDLRRFRRLGLEVVVEDVLHISTVALVGGGCETQVSLKTHGRQRVRADEC